MDRLVGGGRTHRGRARSRGCAEQHGLDRRERLRELGREGIGIPEFPEKLVGLREAAVRAIRAGLEGSGPPPPTKGLQIVPRPTPGQFRLVGELDLTTVDQVEEVCRADLAAGSPLRLDLAGVASMDSQGLRLLIRLGGLALERELTPVVLVNPSGSVQRVLKRAVPKGIPGVDIDDTESDFDGPPH